MTGRYYLYLGAILQAILVFLGGGIVGFGTDHLTVFFGSIMIAKIVFGIGTVVCVLMLTHAYYLLRDGIFISKMTSNT